MSDASPDSLSFSGWFFVIAGLDPAISMERDYRVEPDNDNEESDNDNDEFGDDNDEFDDDTVRFRWWHGGGLI